MIYTQFVEKELFRCGVYVATTRAGLGCDRIRGGELTQQYDILSDTAVHEGRCRCRAAAPNFEPHAVLKFMFDC